MKEFMLDILRQIFGWNQPRTGSLIVTRYSYNKMNEYGLDAKTIREVFRLGREVKRDMIVRIYGRHLVGIVVKPDINTDEFLVITCWRRALRRA